MGRLGTKALDREVQHLAGFATEEWGSVGNWVFCGWTDIGQSPPQKLSFSVSLQGVFLHLLNQTDNLWPGTIPVSAKLHVKKALGPQLCRTSVGF